MKPQRKTKVAKLITTFIRQVESPAKSLGSPLVKQWLMLVFDDPADDAELRRSERGLSIRWS